MDFNALNYNPFANITSEDCCYSIEDSCFNPEEELTYIPDNNFEMALIQFGYDFELDDYILTETAHLSSLCYDAGSDSDFSLGNRNIENLTGIEDFTNLTCLQAYNNQLTSLDVSSLEKLRELQVDQNYSLTDLTIGEKPFLHTLRCQNVPLNELDISGALNIQKLYTSGFNINPLPFPGQPSGSLTEIDLSQNIALEQVFLDNHGLESIALPQTNSLVSLYASYNNLNSIDVSGVHNLGQMYLNNNILTSLDLSENFRLTSENFGQPTSRLHSDLFRGEVNPGVGGRLVLKAKVFGVPIFRLMKLLTSQKIVVLNIHTLIYLTIILNKSLLI